MASALMRSLSPDLLNLAEEGKHMGRLEMSPRSPTGGNAAGRQLRDTKAFTKGNSSVRITVLCNATDDRPSPKNSEVTRVFADEFDAAENGQVRLESLIKSHKSPSRVSALPQLFSSYKPHLPSSVALPLPLSTKTAIRDFLNRAFKVLSVLGVLCLVALLAVPLHGPGKHNVEDFQDKHISRMSGNRFGPRSLGPFGPPGASARSLLAEGLTSVAAKLDEDTVDNYAKPEGYIRKSLMSARVQIDIKQHDLESLQDYFEKQIKSINEDHKAQKEVYEKRLRAQETVLDVVLGEERPDADSEGTSVPPKAFSDVWCNKKPKLRATS